MLTVNMSVAAFVGNDMLTVRSCASTMVLGSRKDPSGLNRRLVKSPSSESEDERWYMYSVCSALTADGINEAIADDRSRKSLRLELPWCESSILWTAPKSDSD